MKVQWKKEVPWFLSAIYGAPQYSRRQQLWEDLLGIADSVSGAWALMGDFNCTLNEHERRGGAQVHVHRDSGKFRFILQECELIDAGFQGDPFTWKLDNLEVRLDRCLINLNWRLIFKKAYIQHIPFLKSDHRPIFLCLERKRKVNQRRRPFWFEAAWLTHEGFKNFMDFHWMNGSGSWNQKKWFTAT